LSRNHSRFLSRNYSGFLQALARNREHLQWFLTVTMLTDSRARSYGSSKHERWVLIALYFIIRHYVKHLIKPTGTTPSCIYKPRTIFDSCLNIEGLAKITISSITLGFSFSFREDNDVLLQELLRIFWSMPTILSPNQNL